MAHGTMQGLRARMPEGAHVEQRVGSVSGQAGEASARAGQLGRRFQAVGRAGWAAKGVVYALMGLLAFTIIREGTGGGEDASSGGAIAALAERSYGGPLLVVVGVGLVLYAVWRLFTVVLPGDWTGKALLERVGYLVSAGVYASLAFTIAQIARDGNGEQAANREDSMVADWVGRLMGNTGGRWLVGLAGVVVAGVAAAFVQKAVTRSFEEDLTFVDGEARRTAVVRLGQFGFFARGVSFALIAFFLVRAAITFKPDEVGGIDGSLRQFAGYSWGRIVVAVVAAGFVAYGAFCVISAKYQCLRGPRND